MNQLEQLVERIRNWEIDAGESFTDYFLDRCAFRDRWMEFLTMKGFHDTVSAINADVFTLPSGAILECCDQQLMYEPYGTEHGFDDWDEEIYLKDVALWGEFILRHEDITKECEEFLSEG